MSLAQRTEFALTTCGGLMANTSLMMEIRDMGFDAIMGDVSQVRGNRRKEEGERRESVWEDGLN